MADRRNDKGKAKVEYQDDDQAIAGSQENQDMILPPKKRWEIEANAQEENISGPSDEPELADDKVPLENTERNVPGPGSRLVTQDDLCLSKTLTSQEAAPQYSKLYFDANDVFLLTGNPEFAEYPPGEYLESLLVFDQNNRRYNMLLADYIRGGKTGYSLNSEWQKFVRKHNLKAGDEITIYKILDTSVSDECYYIIRYFRRPANWTTYLRPGITKKTADDGGQKDPKKRYKLETRRKEDGGMVLKFAKRAEEG